MATKRQRGNTWHYVIKRAGLLPKPVYLTFDTEAEGDAYVARLESLLDNEIIPPELQESGKGEPKTVAHLIRAYLNTVTVSSTDEGVLGVLLDRIGGVVLTRAGTYDWAEQWISEMKRIRRLSPVTIRHHAGALARCFDWGGRKKVTAVIVNPLRQLPRSYAGYTAEDRRVIGEDDLPQEQYRDRRLEPGEEIRIREILSGEKPKDHQRSLALPWQGALECLFGLALETAMRLREMFTLEFPQVDLPQATIFLEKTKNGSKRQVPLSSTAITLLKRYRDQVQCGDHGMSGFPTERRWLFPWWEGTQKALPRITARLSRQFSRIFSAAGCNNLHFHDLRHEASARFFERTDLSDLEISTITGHSDLRMLKRYANLRASTLAKRLW